LIACQDWILSNSTRWSRGSATCSRNHGIEEVWAEIFDVDQSTISRYITFLTPLIDQAIAEFRPSAEEAAEACGTRI
jgi:ferredoxin